MRVFLEKTLHKKENKILKCVYDILNEKYPIDHKKHISYTQLENLLFDVEKYGIKHDDIGWYTKKRRWVGPGDFLPRFIPQFWMKPAAYLHDILYLITKILRVLRTEGVNLEDEKTLELYKLSSTLVVIDKELSDLIFLGVARASKPWFIPWSSIVVKFYKFMLDKCGEMGLEE